MLVSLVIIASLEPIASLVVVAIIVVATCITGIINAATCAIVEASLQELAGVRNSACACAWQKTCIILLPVNYQIYAIHVMYQSAVQVSPWHFLPGLQHRSSVIMKRSS